jgi:hypothetical protein
MSKHTNDNILFFACVMLMTIVILIVFANIVLGIVNEYH